MSREDAPPEPPKLTAEEKAEAKDALEDLPPVEPSEEQADQSEADRERMLVARADDLVPLPSPGSVRHHQKKGPLAGEPDPLRPRDHEDHTEERDPLVPVIPSEETVSPEGERQVAEDGRVESEDERDARLKAAEKAAAERRKARKAKAAEKDK